jgi:hypothetical protein
MIFLSLYEPTNITDISWLLFIQEVNASLEVTKEVTSVKNMYGIN